MGNNNRIGGVVLLRLILEKKSERKTEREGRIKTDKLRVEQRTHVKHVKRSIHPTAKSDNDLTTLLVPSPLLF